MGITKIKQWVILGSNKTYFKQWCAIGPCFGATKKEAYRFISKEDAEEETMKHSFAFVGSKILSVIEPR